MSQDTAEAIGWNEVKRLIAEAEGPSVEIDWILCDLLKMAPDVRFTGWLGTNMGTFAISPPIKIHRWVLPDLQEIICPVDYPPRMTGDLAIPRALIEHLCPIWAWRVGSITNEHHALSPVGKGYEASLATDISRDSTDEFGKKYFVKHSHDPVLAFWLVIVKAICDMLYDHPLAEAVGWEGRIELTGERD